MSSFNEIAGALSKQISALELQIKDTRRYLHQHPEPSGEEFKTTSYLVSKLEGTDLQFRIGPDGRGLIVEGGSQHADRVFGFRADIDALRLNDEKTVSYRSREANLMHACGHDAHTAMALGACLALSSCSKELPANFAWRCIFQPSEETAKGALEMVEIGAADDLSHLISLHVDPTLYVGTIGWREGVLTARCEEFDIIIEGEGGHGARPHTTKDPVPVAAQLIQAIYTQIPRSLDARDASVVSIGVVQGGINPNVIPSSVQLRGTIRSFSEEVSQQIKRRLRELADGISQASNMRASVSIAYSLPSVYNQPEIVEALRNTLTDQFGDAAIVEIDQPSLGGEDFAYYLDKVPGAMFRLGVGTPRKATHHLHSPHFDIDERALEIGSKVLALGTLRLFFEDPAQV